MDFQHMIDSLKGRFQGINILWSVLDVIIITALLYVLFGFLKRKNCSRLIKYIIMALVAVAVLSSKFNLGGDGLILTGSLAAYACRRCGTYFVSAGTQKSALENFIA